MLLTHPLTVLRSARKNHGKQFSSFVLGVNWDVYLYVFISWVLVLLYNIKGVKYAAKVGAKLFNFPKFPSFLSIFLLSSLSTSSSHCLVAFSFTAAFPFYSQTQSFNDSFCLFQPGYVILVIAVILYVALFLLVVHLDDWARGLAILVDFKTDQVGTSSWSFYYGLYFKP